MDIQEPLERLNDLLPPGESQRRLEAPLRALNRKILHSLARRGRPLSREEMAEHLGDARVDTVLQRLASDGLVVLSPEGSEVTGA